MSDIKYWTPVQNAWEKMVQVLFRPFNFGKWMVIGFTAFLATCGRDDGGGGGSGGNSGRSHRSGENFHDGWSSVRDTVVDAWFEYTGLIIFGLCFVLALIILLSILVNWLNSRGQFMFLDNVLKNRGAVQEPWGEYSKEANSLMIFQLVFNWTTGLILLIPLGATLVPIIVMFAMKQFVMPYAGVAVGALLLLIGFSIVCGFVKMMLNHFVVPLMLQRRLTVLAGFRAFRPILKTNFWRIVLFGLVMFLVNTAIGIAIMIGILLTCCTALLLLIIPYISTVVLLPIYVFRRFVGPEFLRQFGDEYDLLAGFSGSQNEAVDASEGE